MPAQQQHTPPAQQAPPPLARGVPELASSSVLVGRGPQAAPGAYSPAAAAGPGAAYNSPQPASPAELPASVLARVVAASAAAASPRILATPRRRLAAVEPPTPRCEAQARCLQQDEHGAGLGVVWHGLSVAGSTLRMPDRLHALLPYLQASSCWPPRPTSPACRAAPCSTPCGRCGRQSLYCMIVAGASAIREKAGTEQGHHATSFPIPTQGTVVRKAWVRPNFKAGGSVRRMQLAPSSGGRAGGHGARYAAGRPAVLVGSRLCAESRLAQLNPCPPAPCASAARVPVA